MAKRLLANCNELEMKLAIHQKLQQIRRCGVETPDFSTASRRIGKRDYFLHGEEMDLEAFCREYGLDVPDNLIKFEIHPPPDEAGIFYALTPVEDEKLGIIGHIRIDFGPLGMIHPGR